MNLPAEKIEVIAPNLKRRLSGVTSTVVRLLPVQARKIGIVGTGPGLPDDVPHMPLWRVALLGRGRWRVWHARRNNEMVLGLILRHLLRRRFRLLFTSAAQRAHKPFTKWLIAQQDALVATSPQAASYLDHSATVVMHGIDTEVFTPVDDRADLRHALGLPKQALLIGCFGRIRAQKGVDLLVEAACALLPERPDVQVIFTGRATADQQEFLRAQQDRLAQAGIAERVHFLGEIPWADVVRHYQALDLFVAPARWEGFGLTPIEAMACGTPALACRGVGAFEAQILSGETGDLCARDDAADLTRALAALIDDRAALAAMRPKARAHVIDKFSITREADQLIGVYRAMLA